MNKKQNEKIHLTIQCLSKSSNEKHKLQNPMLPKLNLTTTQHKILNTTFGDSKGCIQLQHKNPSSKTMLIKTTKCMNTQQWIKKPKQGVGI
jgi:hypothetical protein